MIANKEPHPQEKARRYAKWPDQHGRMWGGYVEKATNHPCSTIYPEGWSAPWLPPAKYVVVSGGEDEAPTLRVDYDGFIAELIRAHKDWEDACRAVGVARHHEEYDPNNPSDFVLNTVGPKPPAIEPVVMAKNGDPWMLGLSDKKPAWAELYFAPKPSAEDEIIRRMRAVEEKAVMESQKPAPQKKAS
jgi:hypothetical protein